MNKFRTLLLALSFILPSSASYAKDTIASHILVNFEKSQYKTIEPAAVIPPQKVVKLWGWMQLISDGVITPEAYYLEWVYKNGDKIENLGNYNTNKKYLVYTRKLDREEAYYWVSKRVWTRNKGEYIFNVYIKDGNEYKLISQSSVAVGE